MTAPDGEALTEHVSIRFPEALAAAAAQIAARDGMSTGAWVRKIVDRELASRRRPDLLSLPWRTGRHVGRTIYAMPGPVASDDDPLIGVMDSPELAAEAVDAHNWRLAMDDACTPANPDAESRRSEQALPAGCTSVTFDRTCKMRASSSAVRDVANLVLRRLAAGPVTRMHWDIRMPLTQQRILNASSHLLKRRRSVANLELLLKTQERPRTRMDDTSFFGIRLRQAREERGLSRDRLAERSGVSAGFIARLERGEREPSITTVYALAGALGVTPARLLDQRERLEPNGGNRGILPVRDVLLGLGDLPGIDVDGDGTPAVLTALEADVADCWDLYWTGRLGALAGRLPGLITAARATETEAGTPACRPLAQACQLAADLMVHMGDDDLAYIAARSALLAAHRGDDPVQHATLGGTLSWVLLHAGRLTEAERVAAASAALIRPGGRAPLPHLCVYGALLLSAAAPAAAAGRGDAVAGYMSEAQVAALRFTAGDRHDYEVSFGRSQLAMQRTHQMAVMGEARPALTAAKLVVRDDLLPISWGALHLDKAQAYLGNGDAGGAVGALWEAREVSPEWARHQGLFRSLVDSASSAERRGTERTRKLRATAGLR